ncbi:unnamed protein product [Adineta ricciae]|uniref:Uncharacterized protein n=1 Tax=Adineta ricciae TaxID=249248 RepID=A0A814BF08_ADIRI|nr:unnamed protein product [Adineta ricciae]
MKSSKCIPKNEDVYIDISDQRYEKQKSLARNKKRQDRLENFHLFGMYDHLHTKAQKRRDLSAECGSNYSMQVCDRFTCSDDRSEDYAIKFLNKYRHLNARLLKFEALYVIKHNDTGSLDFILRHPRMKHQAHEYKDYYYRRHIILTYAICLRKSECVQLIESKGVGENEQLVLQYFIHQALYRNIIIENEYPPFSYLITRIVEGEHIYTYSFLSVPVLSCIRILIDSGVDVNEIVSSTKSAPLHLIAQCSNIDHVRSVIRLLLETNAHLDYVNRNGLQAEQVAYDWEIRDLLRVNRKLSLKCQCAHLVNSRNLN